MHICSIRDVLSDEECTFLAETLEQAIDEAEVVLGRHTVEQPPLPFDTPTGDQAEAYLAVLSTAAGRLKVLKHILHLVEGR